MPTGHSLALGTVIFQLSRRKRNHARRERLSQPNHSLIEDWFCGPGERSLDDAEVQFLVEFIQRGRSPLLATSKSPQCLAAGFISLLVVREEVSRAEQTKALAEYFKVDQRTIAQNRSSYSTAFAIFEACVGCTVKYHDKKLLVSVNALLPRVFGSLGAHPSEHYELIEHSTKRTTDNLKGGHRYEVVRRKNAPSVSKGSLSSLLWTFFTGGIAKDAEECVPLGDKPKLN